MSETRFPVYFLSHGGGPWPWVDGRREMFARTAREFAAIPAQLPARPRAVLVITGHWETPQFTVTSAERPPTEYDYYGFPEHTYRLQYPAPGEPALAQRVQQLLAGAGLASAADAQRGFDHGVFVPLALMYPQADVPVVLLSLRSSCDPAEHLRAGQAIAPLRDEGVLIVGSGLTYHNMRGFRQPDSGPVAEAFERWLLDAVRQPEAQRNERLAQWQRAPGARLAHPREDHLLPLMVVAGAAGADRGDRLFLEHAMGVDMGSYRFPALAQAGSP